jgi:membrane protein DedA with SNARE-associated domain
MRVPPDPRRRALLVGVPIVVLSIAGLAAGALTPVLLRDDPLLLLVLESRNRYLLLAGPRVDVVPFVVVGVLRRFASDPFFYLAGRWFGDRAVGWVERQLGGGASVRRVEALFARVAGLLVFLFPGALVCALAGATGMRPRRFVALNLLGSFATVVVLRLVVDAAAGPLAAIIEFNDRNALWLTALFVVATAVWVAVQSRQGRSPFGGGLDELTGDADGAGDADPDEA